MTVSKAALRFLLLVLVLVLLAYGVVETREDRKRLAQTEAELDKARQDIARLIRENLGHEGSNSRTSSIIFLRDFVYKSTRVGLGDFNYRDPVGHFLTLRKGKAQMLCGGMAQTYHWLLRQYGIPARTAQLATRAYVSGQRRGDTHVTVEVFDSQYSKWYVSDPTFNVSFSCNGQGELLDLHELVDCVERGGEVTAIENGIHYLEGRRISEYYIEFDELLYGISAGEVPAAHSIPSKKALERPREGWLLEASKMYKQSEEREEVTPDS